MKIKFLILTLFLITSNLIFCYGHIIENNLNEPVRVKFKLLKAGDNIDWCKNNDKIETIPPHTTRGCHSKGYWCLDKIHVFDTKGNGGATNPKISCGNNKIIVTSCGQGCIAPRAERR